MAAHAPPPDAAAAAAGPEAIGADIRPVFMLKYNFHIEGHPMEVRREAGLDALCPFKDCSVGPGHTVVLSRGAGIVHNHEALLQAGIGDFSRRDGFLPTVPPLSAAAICAGYYFSAALRGDGTVHSWGIEYQDEDGTLGRDDIWAAPAAVGRLPPVALLAARMCGVIAHVVTAADAAHAWGGNCILVVSTLQPRPTHIAALSGLRIRRLACSTEVVAAETLRGELLLWTGMVEQPVQLSTAGAVCFPLRDLICSQGGWVCAADAAGVVWAVTDKFALTATPPAISLAATPLPQRQRAVRLAAQREGVVALTAKGELWDIFFPPTNWRSISAAHPQLPLGLVPYGGSFAWEVVLAPDHCGGRRRLALFARIAARVGVPSDPVREILLPYVVNGVYITGPAHAPFSWPRPAAATAGAHAAAAGAVPR
eukprot:TRINITY_DN7951_c0_g1_i1.p1 TRINITY_DN7951_c0_g1~~TRINITY_DN7951_c0_g1_i1.p1  ORF type:complete len:453 (+),score=101.92 TRINITY_DN7951_c0_g1_i1:86-1360(+)